MTTTWTDVAGLAVLVLFALIMQHGWPWKKGDDE